MSQDHLDTCVVWCTDQGDCPRHECWCRDGGLSYTDFSHQNPLWLTLPATQWLDSDEGTVWDAAMRKVQP